MRVTTLGVTLLLAVLALFLVASQRRARPPSAAGRSPTTRPHDSFGSSARAWATIAARIAAGSSTVAGPGDASAAGPAVPPAFDAPASLTTS